MDVVDLIKTFEGKRLKAYYDQAGIPTIGYGTTHYPDGNSVKITDKITEEEAEKYFRHDLQRFMDGVAAHVTVPLTVNQKAALTSFAYNVGLHAFYHSTLLRKLNQRDYAGAADEFLRWVHAGGHVSKGLQNRRKKERQVFLA